MNGQPLISVLWHGDGSEGGFQDLRMQTWNNLELITDSLCAVPDDARIKTGVPPTGRYLLFAQPPCHFDPTMLETMAAQLESTGAGICVCGVTVAGEKRSVLTCEALRSDQKLALVTRLIEHNLLLTPNNTLLRRCDLADLEDAFLQQALALPMVMLSSAFVTLTKAAARPDARWGAALLRKVLEQGVRE